MDYDFSFMLTAAGIITGVIWGGYVVCLKITGGYKADKPQPYLVEMARSFFPVLLIVLLLRSFIVEPFRIPSGSMMPTLLAGDFILVNKYIYGVRLPVLHTKIATISQPKTGDIVVFRFPRNPQIDYIKRVIGVPGDRVSYYNKTLFINGKKASKTSLGKYQGIGQGASMTGTTHFTENLDGVVHNILTKPNHPAEDSVYIVPKDHYFVMGDNRDGSNDSRYWGTVPAQNLVGKAFFIWMNWDWQHQGIGFERIGTILK